MADSGLEPLLDMEDCEFFWVKSADVLFSRWKGFSAGAKRQKVMLKVNELAKARATNTLLIDSEQLEAGDALDTDRLQATYDAEVLSISIPVVEQAKARKVEIQRGVREPLEVGSHN